MVDHWCNPELHTWGPRLSDKGSKSCRRLLPVSSFHGAAWRSVLTEPFWRADKMLSDHFVPAGFSGAEHALLYFSGYGWNRAA